MKKKKNKGKRKTDSQQEDSAADNESPPLSCASPEKEETTEKLPNPKEKNDVSIERIKKVFDLTRPLSNVRRSRRTRRGGRGSTYQKRRRLLAREQKPRILPLRKKQVK